MKLQVVLAGAAMLALAAGAAQAATHHKAAGKSAGAYAEPSQPVAYAKLDSYLKASGHARTSQSWGLENTGMAAGSATGAGANASANAPQNDMSQPATAPDQQGAAAPAPSAAAPNPPATETSPPSTQASPNTSTDQQAAPGAAGEPPTTSAPK